MHRITRTLHTRVPADGAHAVVTPLFQCSAFGGESPYFYARKDNPNVAELEQAVSTLEGAAHAVAVTTGMTAISLVLDLLQWGDTLVVNREMYGCSFRLIQRLRERRGFAVRVLDLAGGVDPDDFPTSTRMVLFETPTNPFLRTIDVRRIAEVAERRGNALVVVDNTWATPLFQRPLEHGADISLHSATKYFSGHSDVMGGMLLTERDDLHRELREARFYQGAILDPHSAWLLRRSLQTLPLRMREHERSMQIMHAFLAACPQVARVHHPIVDGRQLTGYGGILCFELRADLAERYADFAGALQLFGTGTGMACVTSMVAQPYSGSHASLSTEEKAAMGLGRNLVRLCFGLEDADDLRRDLTAAFAAIDPPAEERRR